MHSLLYIFKIPVCVDEMSDQKHVKCGVPQGSVCGPLPFRFLYVSLGQRLSGNMKIVSTVMNITLLYIFKLETS